MKITLVIDVPKIRTTKEGTDFAASLAEHIVETYSDDCSIKSIASFVPNERRPS